MTLNTALSLTYDQLNAVAQSPDYWTILNTAFGANYNQTLAQTLQSQWQAGDFSALPPVEILSSSTLGKANGAYAQSTNKIYLSDSFLATASEDQLVAVLLEEIGHSIDAKINQTDSAGDEGELFSLLVRGLIPSATELNRLQTENDQATIVIDGQLVAIEQAVEPTLVWAKRLGGTDYDNVNSLEVDSSGNVYTTGIFSGTADFDPGTGVSNLTSAGGNDVFIIKLALPVTNQAPTDLSLSANTIAENTVIGAGVKIGNITITDPDATGNNNLLTVEGTDAANFEIRNSTELFFIGTSPDFETKPSYTISLKSTDGALTYSEAFTVNVTDVKPKVTISPGTTPVEGGAIGTYTITLDEASPTGGLVINFNTTGSTATLSTDYTLTAGSNITAVTANSFTIAAGQTTAILNLNALADVVSDPNETVQINLSSGPGYSLGQNSTALLSPKTDYTVGSLPYSVAVGDFNGDGKLDLATANQNSDTVSVLL